MCTMSFYVYVLCPIQLQIGNIRQFFSVNLCENLQFSIKMVHVSRDGMVRMTNSTTKQQQNWCVVAVDRLANVCTYQAYVIGNSDEVCMIYEIKREGAVQTGEAVQIFSKNVGIFKLFKVFDLKGLRSDMVDIIRI